jgi:hypothetical protein
MYGRNEAVCEHPTTTGRRRGDGEEGDKRNGLLLLP